MNAKKRYYNEKKNFNTLCNKLTEYYENNVISYIEKGTKKRIDENARRIILDELKSDPLTMRTFLLSAGKNQMVWMIIYTLIIKY